MKRLIYSLSVILLFLSACTEPITINLNTGENNRLIVEGSISSEKKAHAVKLSRSLDYFANKGVPPELDANVTITDGTNTYQLTDADRDGIYLTAPDVQGEPGKKYTLNIKLKTGETYTANSAMRDVYPMDSIAVDYVQDTVLFGSKESFYVVYAYAQEKPGLGDCYQWRYYLDGKMETDTLKEVVFVEDEMVDGNYIKDWQLYLIPASKIEKDVVDLTLEMQSMDADYYNYCTALMLETVWKGSMFDGPPANVVGNISNGGLGYFKAYEVSRVSTKIYRLKRKG